MEKLTKIIDMIKALMDKKFTGKIFRGDKINEN